MRAAGESPACDHNAERAHLLSVEAAAAQAETRAARENKKIGTFGYQVLNDVGTHVGYIVDEAGNHLPAKAVYAYEVVDDNPPLPEWAMKDGRAPERHARK